MRKPYPCPYCDYRSNQQYYHDGYQNNWQSYMCDSCRYQPCPHCNQPMPRRKHRYYNNYLPNVYIKELENQDDIDYTDIYDYGPEPFVINIEEATDYNQTFRTALWTGSNLQLTLMSIPVGEDIGLELHPDTDQFIRIEEGEGIIYMGDNSDNLDFNEMVHDEDVIIIPAGKWHNLVNSGNEPLKLYSVYAPPKHPFGTVHQTKADAMEE